jgi:molybdopterin-guanine dinucleotide biosynthesis protein A
MQSQPTLPLEDITGLVLAGGRAQRMGGVDKGLVPLAGRPMVAHVLAALRPQVGAILINANRHLDQYAAFGHPLIADRHEGFLGPLAGLAVGLDAALSDYVATVPCDSPLLGPDLVARLAGALIENGADISYAHDGERAHPVFALVRRRLRGDLDAYLAGGGRKIDQWFARHPHVAADFSDCPDTFINVNSPEERQMLEARLLEAASC